MTTTLPVDVVSVFTDPEGGFGNPLGLVWSSSATSGREQQIATALGFSETVFVEEIVDGAATIRIFTPARELPFAGHPSVGTSWWLAEGGTPVTALQVTAGTVSVRYDGDLTWITGRAAWAPEFVWHEFGTPGEVDALDGQRFDENSHYAWAWIDEAAGHLRSRMFAPALGVPEDEATGAAAVRLTALLDRDLAIDQGRGSRILTRRLADDLIEVGGRTRRTDPVSITLD